MNKHQAHLERAEIGRQVSSLNKLKKERKRQIMLTKNLLGMDEVLSKRYWRHQCKADKIPFNDKVYSDIKDKLKDTLEELESGETEETKTQ